MEGQKTLYHYFLAKNTAKENEDEGSEGNVECRPPTVHLPSSDAANSVTDGDPSKTRKQRRVTKRHRGNPSEVDSDPGNPRKRRNVRRKCDTAQGKARLAKQGVNVKSEAVITQRSVLHGKSSCASVGEIVEGTDSSEVTNVPSDEQSKEHKSARASGTTPSTVMESVIEIWQKDKYASAQSGTSKSCTDIESSGEDIFEINPARKRRHQYRKPKEYVDKTFVVNEGSSVDTSESDVIRTCKRQCGKPKRYSDVSFVKSSGIFGRAHISISKRGCGRRRGAKSKQDEDSDVSHSHGDTEESVMKAKISISKHGLGRRRGAIFRQNEDSNLFFHSHSSNVTEEDSVMNELGATRRGRNQREKREVSHVSFVGVTGISDEEIIDGSFSPVSTGRHSARPKKEKHIPGTPEFDECESEKERGNAIQVSKMTIRINNGTRKQQKGGGHRTSPFLKGKHGTKSKKRKEPCGIPKLDERWNRKEVTEVLSISKTLSYDMPSSGKKTNNSTAKQQKRKGSSAKCTSTNKGKKRQQSLPNKALKKKPLELGIEKFFKKPTQVFEIDVVDEEVLYSEFPKEIRETSKEMLVNVDTVLFPCVSHVQQLSHDDPIWHLPDKLSLFSHEEDDSSPEYSTTFMDMLLERDEKERKCYRSQCETLSNIMLNIQEDSGKFPVAKALQTLQIVDKPQEKEVLTNWALSNVSSSTVMWTEKYQPCSLDDMVGNKCCLRKFKRWLETWRANKLFTDNDSSGCEFIDATYEDKSSKREKNSLVLAGKSGTGKTCAVYIAAKELGYKVLEINASSRRSGRFITSSLQEATQSHQVRGSYFSLEMEKFMESSTTKSAMNATKGSTSKEEDTSLILIDDADIIFNTQDEGFVNALTSLLSSTKRPIVLTVTNKRCPHLTRIIESSLVLELQPAPSPMICTWLQLVCLVEGMWVNKKSIEDLYQMNKFDVRQTLLSLQFWTLSGGEHVANHFPKIVLPHGKDAIIDEKLYPQNSNCVKAFLQPADIGLCQFPVDMGEVWWCMSSLHGFATVRHIPKMMRKDHCNASSCSEESGEDNSFPRKTLDPTVSCVSNKTCTLENITLFSEVCDFLAIADVLSATYTEKENSFEPTPGLWNYLTSDNISLEERNETIWIGSKNTADFICHFLVENSISISSKEISTVPKIIAGSPSENEFKWRAEQQALDLVLWKALPSTSQLSRHIMSTELVPFLRFVAKNIKSNAHDNRRMRSSRSQRQSKHDVYFSDWGLRISPQSLEILSSVFNN